MRKYSILIFFILLLPLSCRRETEKAGEETTLPERKVTYTLTGKLSDKTKAFIADDGTFSWALGDKADVLDSNSGTLCEFTCTDIDNEGNGIFTFQGTEGVSYSFTRAWYPASMASLDGGGKPVITLPSAWTASSISEARNFPMDAKVSEGQMSFYHLGGLLKITMNDVPSDAESIVLSSASTISGGFSINEAFGVTGENVIVETDEIPVKTVSEIVPGETASSVSVTDLNLTAKGTVTAYIPLPCGTYKYKISLKVGTETVFEKETSSAKEIGRANLIKMGALSPWPAAQIKAVYGSSEVAFVPSDLWGWLVAAGIPADQNVLIDDAGTQYGTRFATKKHAGYLCELLTGSTAGAFPLKQASDLYISSGMDKIFPLAAGASVAVPAEYEVAHYGLRGDFAGTLSSYTSAGKFTRTADIPASDDGWAWYVVRGVACSGTPIAFKLYGTAYKAEDGVLETGTSTPQNVGVTRSLARPVSGTTSAVKFNVTPGMSYDVYLREDLSRVIVCEAGSYNSSMDESYLTGLTNYGLYNYNGESYICTPGTDQTWVVTSASSATFVFTKGYTFDRVEMSNLPATAPSLNQSVGVGVSVIPSIGSSLSSTVDAKVVKIDGNKLWLLSDDGTGIIADYRR